MRPKKLIELMKIQQGASAADIIDAFFSSPEFPRVIEDSELSSFIQGEDDQKKTVEATSQDGIDPNWIRNAVEEPIEEAGVTLRCFHQSFRGLF